MFIFAIQTKNKYYYQIINNFKFIFCCIKILIIKILK